MFQGVQVDTFKSFMLGIKPILDPYLDEVLEEVTNGVSIRNRGEMMDLIIRLDR